MSEQTRRKEMMVKNNSEEAQKKWAEKRSKKRSGIEKA